MRPAVVLGAGCLAASLLAGVAVLARAHRPRAPLPVLGHVPTFHFVDQSGAPFDTSAMAGHVSVVDFVFTRCPSSCPRLTAHMADLQSHLEQARSGAHLASFTVDPDYDTPPVLAAYATRAHADPARWSFVTGPSDDVEKAIVQGFKVSAAKVAKGAHDYDVVHGDWFVLVDGKGDLRGYYAMDEAGATDKLAADVSRLEREGP